MSKTRSEIRAGRAAIVALGVAEEERKRLAAFSGSRPEPASRVSRAQMLLAYRENPSFCAVGQRVGVHHQTVQRCVARAQAYGSLACDKAKEHGYPHELWTTRLLARHARERGPMAGHECLANLVQGTVCVR